MTRSTRLVLGISTCLLAAACSTSEREAPDQRDAAVVSPSKNDGAPGSEGRGGSAARCEGPGYATSAESIAFNHVSAVVTDAAGGPVRKVIAQACGTNVCLNGTTDATGHVAIDADVSMTKPAFKYGGGQLYAKFALPIEGAAPLDRDLGTQVTFGFDAPETGLPFTPGGTAAMHGIELSFARDMAPVEPDPFDFDTDDLKKLRAITIPVADAPAAVDPKLAFEILVAFTPVGAELCPAAGLSVPNSPGWDAGSAVEFYLHGVDVAEEWAPYGGWAKVSDGSVSDDGKTVRTSAGGGIPSLSVVGIRLAP